ncbi:hypothetical protein [Mammaliicoccus sciuri]|uniref:hypothetical protein n=1 Tax=Mammaliicoccus sciuri TaxID=1296 RepID=UPI0028844125|nr:hypothetical protein [Mammaliicoccus sciuri]MDT0702589.1 hypothetical protein [Mammaliicoccus sciuri]
MEKKIDYTFEEEPEGDIKHSLYNIDKLKQLGFSLKYLVEESLFIYIEYSQGHID